MKNSIFRWFFVTIFCLIFSIGVQASSSNDLTRDDLKALEAGTMSVEKLIKKAKGSQKIPLGDIVRLMVEFYPDKEEIEKSEEIKNAIIHVIQTVMKGENVEANITTIMQAAIGILITGSGIGEITNETTRSDIIEVADAAKEVNAGASNVIDTVVTAILATGVANEGVPTSPN